MQSITAFKRQDFRKWLAKNHDKETKIAIILHKKHTGKSSPSHRELMEEAICFGWIDTTVKRLDDHTYLRHFSKRNKNSRWSDNTLSYAKQLIKQKKMAQAGLKFYKEGLNKPTLNQDIPKNPDMPEELKQALEKAKTNLNSFPPSAKRMIYRWVLSAKRQETRDKRIKIIVEKAKQGKKDIFTSQQNS